VACVGAGLLNPALANVAIGSVDEANSGLAAGVNDAFRQGGIAVGVAAFGALVPAGAALGKVSTSAFVSGLHEALLIGTGLCAVGAIIAARLIFRRSAPTPSFTTPDMEPAVVAGPMSSS
jgi:hypothetical protein